MARPGHVQISDTDPGFRRMIGELGEMGSVVIGVQGAEAAKTYDNGLTVGQNAAMHELGTGGMVERSWLRAWMDQNAPRLYAETKTAMQQVLAGQKSRKQALQDLGYEWTKQVRARIEAGQVTPPLAASTIARKGHSIPLWDSGKLAAAISYTIFLPLLKSIRDTAQRTAARGKR